MGAGRARTTPPCPEPPPEGPADLSSGPTSAGSRSRASEGTYRDLTQQKNEQRQTFHVTVERFCANAASPVHCRSGAGETQTEEDGGEGNAGAAGPRLSECRLGDVLIENTSYP